jgi:hypothetical protein
MKWSQERFPRTPLDDFLINFLATGRKWPPFEQGLLNSLSEQEGITARQRYFLWRIVAKFYLPTLHTLPPDKLEIIELAQFLLHSTDHFYRDKWAKIVGKQLTETFEESLKAAARSHYTQLSDAEIAVQQEMKKDHEA